MVRQDLLLFHLKRLRARLEKAVSGFVDEVNTRRCINSNGEISSTEFGTSSVCFLKAHPSTGKGRKNGGGV